MGDFFLLDARAIGQSLAAIPAFLETTDDSNFVRHKQYDDQDSCTVALFGVDAAGDSMAVMLTEYAPVLRFLLPRDNMSTDQVLRSLCSRHKDPDKAYNRLRESGLRGQVVLGYYNGNEYEPREGAPQLRRQRAVLEMRFSKLSAWREARQLGRVVRARPLANGVVMCEHWLEPEQAIYEELRLRPGSWLTLGAGPHMHDSRANGSVANRTLSQVEVHLRYRGAETPLSPGDAERPQPPIKAISWDIETATRAANEFPLAHHPECRIATIATTTMLLGGGTGDAQRKNLLVKPRCHFFYLGSPGEPVSLAHLEAEGALEGTRGATVTPVPCRTENDLLHTFARFVRAESAQLLVGWNSFAFDNNYLIRRVHRLFGGIATPTRKMEREDRMRHSRRALCSFGQLPYLCGEPRAVGRGSQAEEGTDSGKRPGQKQLSVLTGADGKVSRRTDGFMAVGSGPAGEERDQDDPEAAISKCDDSVRFDSMGLANLDAMAFIQANGEGYETYALGKLGQLLLGASKDDLSYAQLHAILAEPTAEGLQKVALYNCIDTILPLRILLEKDTVAQMISLSRVTFTNLSDCRTRGQQYRLGNMYAHYARSGRAKYVLPSRPLSLPDSRPECAGTYPGADVLPPCRGRHTEVVGCVDYKSLYPSLIISGNLSPEMLFSDCSRDWVPPEGLPEGFYTERVLRETEERGLARRSHGWRLCSVHG